MGTKLEAVGHTPVDTTLWCVSIKGPDDLIAATDRKQAVEMAAAFNAMVVSRFEVDPHPYSPLLWATPGSWPYDAASHSESLGSDDEYAWLRVRS